MAYDGPERREYCQSHERNEATINDLSITTAKNSVAINLLIKIASGCAVLITSAFVGLTGFIGYTYEHSDSIGVAASEKFEKISKQMVTVSHGISNNRKDIARLDEDVDTIKKEVFK